MADAFGGALPAYSVDVTTQEQSAGEVRRVLSAVKERLAHTSEPKINEAATRQYFITPLLAALGYRTIADLALEEYVSDSKTFLDYRLLVAGKACVSVEAKSLDVTITDQHAAQAVQYATVLGDPWAVVTNAREWRLYETFAPVALVEKHVLTIDLVGWESDPEFDAVFEQLWLCSRESFEAGEGPTSWMASKKLDSLLRYALTDPASPEIRYLRKRLQDASVSVSTEAVASWFLSRLEGPPGRGVGRQEPLQPTTVAQTRLASDPQKQKIVANPSTTRQPMYWIVPAGNREGLKALDYLQLWLSRGYWALGQHTPGRRAIQPGDRVCFYAAGNRQVVATANVSGDLSNPITPAEWPEPHPQKAPLYKMPLDAVTWLGRPVRLDDDLRSRLDALQGKFGNRWALWVQVPRQLTKHDFDLLTHG
jgi:hypothetical protein